MGGFQKVTILGILGKDPDMSYSTSGMAICKFSMATSRKQKDGTEKTSWHRLVSFNKSAELIGQYVSKGQELFVEGELNYGSYEKDGQTVYTTDIIVNQFSFIGGKPQGQQQQSGGYQQQVGQQQGGYQNQGGQNQGWYNQNNQHSQGYQQQHGGQYQQQGNGHPNNNQQSGPGVPDDEIP